MNADATISETEACGLGASDHRTTVYLLLAVVLILLTVSITTDLDAEAETFYVDGIEYRAVGENASIVGINSDVVVDYVFPDVVEYNSLSYIVNTVEINAFKNSLNLNGSIVLPTTLTIINTDSFYGCNNISSLTIPSGLICEGAISNCINLQNITLGENTEFESSIVKNCQSVRLISYDSLFDTKFVREPFNEVNSTNVIEVDFGESVSVLISGLFSNLGKIFISNDIIGGNISKISSNVFSGCTFVENHNVLTIGSTVVSIHDKAFDGMLNIRGFFVDESNIRYVSEDGALYSKESSSYDLIRVPNLIIGAFSIKSGTISIKSSSFDNCTSISSIHIPASLSDVSLDILRAIISLESITVASDNLVYCSVDGVLCSKNPTEMLLYPISKRDLHYTVSSTIVGLKTNSISECVYLEKITIGPNVTSIEENSICYCSKLNEIIYNSPYVQSDFVLDSGTVSGYVITFGEESGIINSYFLSNDLNLTTIRFESTHPMVKLYAFYECNELKSIEFCNDLESIGGVSFLGCNHIESITVPITFVDKLPTVFPNTSALNEVILSSGSTGICPEGPKSGNIWSSSKTSNNVELVLEDGVISIDSSLFFGCSNIRGSFNLPSTIKIIEEGSFKDANFTSIIVANGNDYFCIIERMLFSKDSSTLYWCPKDVVTIKLDHLTSHIGDYAFFGCSHLSTIFTCNEEIVFDIGSLDTGVESLCTLYSYYDDFDTGVFGNTSSEKYKIDTPLSIRYDVLGGSYSKPLVNYLIPVPIVDIPLEFPVRQNYTFVHWLSNDGQFYNPGDCIVIEDKSIILVAVWAKTNYAVIFNPNGGTGTEYTDNFTYGVQKEFPMLGFTVERQVQLSWNTKSDGSGYEYPLDYSESKIILDGVDYVTLYAIWSDYPTIFFDTNGGSNIDPITAPFDSFVNLSSTSEKEGYTFIQWSPAIPDRMPAEDMTCVAQWEINTYDITFDLAYDGKKIVRSYTYGTPTSPEVDPERTGYAFSEWDGTIPDRMPATDITITAIWVANTYSIVFMPNGGVGSMPQLTATYDSGTGLTLCSFERTGYTFSGWSYSTDGDVSFSDGYGVRNLATGEDGDDTVVLYAKWSANTYVVNFNSNDGISRKISRTFTYDSEESLPTGLFTRVGHSFLGWASEPTGEVIRVDGAKANNLSTGGTMELHALWSVNTYRIHFVDTGDSVIGDIVKEYGSDIVSPNDPIRKGYAFNGWDMDIPSTMPGNDMTIAATWVANTYSIVFMSNGGTGSMSPLDVIYDSEMELIVCTFERAGYSFIGWSRTTNGVVSFSDGENVRNLATGAIGDDAVILYAKWSANTYVVNFNSNYGENEKVSRTFVYDSDVSLPTGLFSRVGHTLSGWALESSGDPMRVDGAKVDNLSTGESVELYAVWAVNTYRIHFINTGDSIIEDIVALYGSSIVTPDDPIREGYTFTGWNSDIPDTMPANDLEIGAEWSVNTYRIHFANTGDSVIHDIVMVYGSSITSPDDPVRRGYTFMHWSKDIPDTMPADDLTIEAIWVANTYSIRFMSNGGSGTMSPLTVTYDSDTELADCSLERAGYTFMGWSLSSEGPVSFMDGSIIKNLVTGADGDDIVTMFAIWSANTYVVNFNSNDGRYEVVSRTFTYDSDESLPTGLFTRVGHTMSGWALEPSGESVRGDGAEADNLTTDGRIELYAVWSVNIYRIQFVDTGDSIIDDIVASYGSSIIAPDDPVRKGHTFMGWDSEIPESVPAKDLTITATWSVNSYGISFEGCELDDMVVEFGTVLDLTDPTRIGYDFTGWYEEVPISMPDHGLTFTATWSACKVHVGFHGFDDLELIVDYDSEYGELPVVSRPGHDFRGWYADESLSIPIVSDVKVTNPSDHMLYGHFVKIWTLSLHPDDLEHGYVEGSGVFDDGTSVSFEAVANEGFAFIKWTDGNRDPERELRLDSDLELTAVFSRVRTISLMIDTEVRVLDCPTGESVPLPTCDHSKKGFEFIGWTDGKQRYPVSSQFIMGDKDATLHGVWSPLRYTLTLEFTPDDVRTFDLYPGESLPTVDVPEVYGKVFVGWDTDRPGSMPLYDLYLRAVWVDRFVRYTFDDGESSKVMSLRVGSDVPDIESPIKEGYVFEGWSPNVPDVVGDEGLTFVAEWSLGTYSVRFIALDESQMSIINIEYGKPIVPIADPVRIGYDFIGWSPLIPETMPGRDLSFHAMWEESIFSIVLDCGEEIITLEGTYGSEVSVPDRATVREGYEFRGWTMDVPDTFPDHDMVIRGKWEPKVYTVTFDLDEDVVMDVPCGDRIPTIRDPVEEGKRFTGWAGWSDHMPASDVVLIPEWESEVYVATFHPLDGSDSIQIPYHFGDSIEVPNVPDSVTWYPVVPSEMPSHDTSFFAMDGCMPDRNGSIPEYHGNGDMMMVNVEGIVSDTLRIINDGAWSMLCRISEPKDVHGYLVVKVSSTGTYGEYDIDVHHTEGLAIGDVVVNLPYLGHVGDRVLVRSTDMSGSHTMETVCSEVDGRLFLSVETSPLSRCQILSVVDETDGPLPAYVVPMAGAGMVLTILALIIWRRSKA